jgi:effector-binding domain-containing protein
MASITVDMTGGGKLMDYFIERRRVETQLLAAVRRRMRAADIPKGFREPLDKVWAFLGRHPGLRTDGHNVFLYRHDMDAGGAMTIDFGVQVARSFETADEVACVMTPKGEAAATLHRGPYNQLGDAHHAVHEWIAKNGRRVGGSSWEIYGDWSDDPAKLETEVICLLE